MPIVIFYSGKQAIKSRTGDTIYDKIAQKIPDSLKQKIKEKIFTSDYLRQEIYLKDKLINELEIKENKKNLIVLNQYKKLFFKKILEDEYKINDNLLKYNFFPDLPSF